MVHLILKVENVTNDPCSGFCRSGSHLCYCAVNARQQKFPVFMPKLFGSKITHPPCMIVKVATAVTSLHSGQREIWFPLSVTCVKRFTACIWNALPECISQVDHLQKKKKKKRRRLKETVRFFWFFFQTLWDFYIKRRVIACEKFYSWNMFHLEDSGENMTNYAWKID